MVIGLLAKLLMTKQLKFENGLIKLKDSRMTILPAFFTSEMTDYFIRKNKVHELYLFSWYWGHNLMRQVKKQFNLNNSDKMYGFGMDLAEAMGFGFYKTHSFHPGKYSRFEIHDNSFIKPLMHYYKKTENIDHFVSGFMSGGGSLVHGEVCNNIELECMITGAEKCEFLTGTEKELKERGYWNDLKKRYNIEKILPIQKHIFDSKKPDSSEELEYVISELNKM